MSLDTLNLRCFGQPQALQRLLIPDSKHPASAEAAYGRQDQFKAAPV